MAQTLFAYDRQTGVLLGTTSFFPNPERPADPLQPAFSTPLVPPDLEAGQAAVFLRGEWSVEPDHRGERWWKGSDPVLIDAVGDPTALGLTAAPVMPPPPPPSSCSKLGLKRAFDEKGLWPTVRAMISSNADMQEDWDLAIELRITDPVVQSAVAGLAQLGHPLTADEVQSLVTRANELVA